MCLAGSVSLCSLQLALTKRKHRLRTVISDVSLRLHRTLGRTGAGTSPLFCPGIGSFYRARKRLGKAGDARTASEVSAEGWGLSLLVISSLIVMVIVLVVMQQTCSTLAVWPRERHPPHCTLFHPYCRKCANIESAFFKWQRLYAGFVWNK